MLVLIIKRIIYPIVCTFIVLTSSFFVTKISAEEEQAIEHTYSIYFADEDCKTNPVSLVHKVVDEDFLGVGGRSSDGICAQETICFHEASSAFCQEELNRTVSGIARQSVDKFGVVGECDTSNKDNNQGECFFSSACKSSSLFPNCHYITRESSDLFSHPQIMKNENLINSEHEHLSYMLFYSDSECKVNEGIEGVVAGDYNLTVTGGQYTCDEAMICLASPTGEQCQSNIDQQTISKTLIQSEIRNDAKDVYNCTSEDGACSIVPTGCMPSPIPSCYFRWTSAVNLLTSPETFLYNEVDEADAPQTTESSSSIGVVLGNTLLLLAFVSIFVIAAGL